jgi:LPS export ABC transporter protein LptC
MTLAGNMLGSVMRSRIQLRLRSLVGAFAALLALAACGAEPPTEVAPEEILGIEADMISYGMTTYFTNAQGVRTGKIDADSAYFFQDSTVVHMQGVNMTVSTEAGQVRATVTADKGRYDERTQQMHAIGNVVLVMPNDARQVESGELYYDPMTEKIWSDSASTYNNRGQITRGTCFQSNLDFTAFNVCNIRGSADFGGP